MRNECDVCDTYIICNRFTLNILNNLLLCVKSSSKLFTLSVTYSHKNKSQVHCHQTFNFYHKKPSSREINDILNFCNYTYVLL